MNGSRYDICCIGHLTIDRVVTPNMVKIMPGGTVFYFSSALAKSGMGLKVITSFAARDRPFFHEHGLRLECMDVSLGRQTHFFENIYEANSDNRSQCVLGQGDTISSIDFSGINASWYHFGPLMANDIDEGLVSLAAERGAVSLDVQGQIRRVRGNAVVDHAWGNARKILPYVTTLKANHEEARKLTGRRRLKDCISELVGFGVKEVVITLGRSGSVIHTQGKNWFIPSYLEKDTVDATGCGDTFMAGYLYSKMQGASICEAGHVGAVIAAEKASKHGPFTGDVRDTLATYGKRMK